MTFTFKEEMSMTSVVGGGGSGEGCTFTQIGMMLIEGRTTAAATEEIGGGGGGSATFKEGPHCPQLTNQGPIHVCQDSSFMCERARKVIRHMSLLNDNSAPMVIDVSICPECPCGQARANSINICQVSSPVDLLVEQWTVSIINSKTFGGVGRYQSSNVVTGRSLLQAIRSSLHFSQINAWHSLGKVKYVSYRLSHPVRASGFSRPPIGHDFPLAVNPDGSYLKVSLKSLPRLESIPIVSCPMHSSPSALTATVTVFKSVFAELGQCLLDPPTRLPNVRNGFMMWRDSTKTRRKSPLRVDLVDDRMMSGCKHIGKHHCQDDPDLCSSPLPPPTPTAGPSKRIQGPSRISVPNKIQDLRALPLLPPPLPPPPAQVNPLKRKSSCSISSSSSTTKKLLSEFNKRNDDDIWPNNQLVENFHRLNINNNNNKVDSGSNSCLISSSKRKNDEDDVKGLTIPLRTKQSWTDSSSEETEGESPIGQGRISIRDEDEDYESNPMRRNQLRRRLMNNHKYHKPLLGNFDENLLNGRLRPSSIVDGFTADFGASGSFCPQHLKLNCKVSFYEIEPHSTPYTGEIKLGRKGYTVPDSGSVQLTLLNPSGTVVKIFVVPYDVTDMPNNSHTFVRQKTAHPALNRTTHLIHIRMTRSKSGRVSIISPVKLMINLNYDHDSSTSRVELSDPSTRADANLRTTTSLPLPKYTMLK